MRYSMLAIAVLASLSALGAPQKMKPGPVKAKPSASFSTVSAGSPAVKSALKPSDSAKAMAMVGKMGGVTGTVTKVYTSRAATFIDFDKEFKSDIAIYLSGANASKFGDLQSIVGKRVLITGRFATFKEKPEIVLSDPKQIKFVN